MDMLSQVNVNNISSLDCDNLEVATDDHLRNLKALAERLRLQTRRPSYQEWKAQVEATSAKGPSDPIKSTVSSEDAGQEHTDGHERNSHKLDLTQECSLTSRNLKGFDSIDEALIWLRKELVRKNKRSCIEIAGQTMFN